MSYEPLILIKKSSLEYWRTEITEIKEMADIANKSLKEIDFCMDILYKALNASPVSFEEIDLVLINVEGTERNKGVRKLLNNYDIEYREWQ